MLPEKVVTGYLMEMLPTRLVEFLPEDTIDVHFEMGERGEVIKKNMEIHLIGGLSFETFGLLHRSKIGNLERVLVELPCGLFHGTR